MKADLLLKLADLLEANAANEHGVKFDYNYWGLVPPDKNGNATAVTLDCHTTACALGLAAISGQFPGLTYGIGNYDRPTNSFWLHPLLEGEDPDRSTGSYIAAKVFDIPHGEARMLFTEMPIKDVGAVGERQIASIIRRYVAGEDLWEIRDRL